MPVNRRLQIGNNIAARLLYTLLLENTSWKNLLSRPGQWDVFLAVAPGNAIQKRSIRCVWVRRIKWDWSTLRAAKNSSSARGVGSQSSDSNARKRPSISHCWWALSLDCKTPAQLEESFSAPSESREQAETMRVKTSCATHKLAPGKKLCSRPVRTIRLRSA